MKHLVSLILIVALAALPLTQGCSITPSRAAFNVQVATRVGIVPAWNTFRTLRSQGKVPDNEWKIASNAMQSYKETGNALLDAVIIFKQTNNQEALDKAIAAAARAQQLAISILVRYVPELRSP